MILKVKVIPNSRTESIQKIGEFAYRLKLKEKAVEGRANSAAIDAIAEYFNVKKADVSIVHGLMSREKTVEVRNYPADCP